MNSKKIATEKQLIGLGSLLASSGAKYIVPRILFYRSTRAATHRHPDGKLEITVPSRNAPTTKKEHVEFALKREAIDLGAWKTVLDSFHSDEVTAWIKEHPLSKPMRKLWYLYENLTGEILDLPDCKLTVYEPLANPKLQHVANVQKSPRHKIADNLLGNFEYCPLVRVSDKLATTRLETLKKRAHAIARNIDSEYFERAVDYLYHKETKASFLIEREDVSPTRMERFVAALRQSESARWYNQAELTELQNAIVDPRYVEDGWRDVQVFVGQTRHWGEEKVHFMCPQPGDVPGLMDGWKSTLFRSVNMVDPICQAAILGFGFVFIHPFEDGNGRLHRFVIHATLVRRGFTPKGVIIPVSATMLKDRAEYDRVLETYSTPRNFITDYGFDARQNPVVNGSTADLHRFWDATPQCEYLYDVIEDALEVDLPEEVRTLKAYDAGRRILLEIVDMPNRRADLLMSLLIQNGYKLSARKREMFQELSDEDLARIEFEVRRAAEEAGSADHTDQVSLFEGIAQPDAQPPTGSNP